MRRNVPGITDSLAVQVNRYKEAHALRHVEHETGRCSQEATARTVALVGTGRHGRTSNMLQHRWPAAMQVADVMIGRERWATVVGLYGLTVDVNDASVGHGRYSVPRMLQDLEPLLSSKFADRLVLAGDLNMWPVDAANAMRRTGLVDLVEHTSHTRPALAGCSGCTMGAQCGHMWTHRNGNAPGAAVQNIDFIYASTTLVRELRQVTGGVHDYPDTWNVSDHAPVVADFT